ncbi:unnamed protein product, partial [Symbiodinium natans]
IRIFVFLQSLRVEDRQEESQNKKSDDPPASGDGKKAEPQQPSTANIKLESDQDRQRLRQRKKKDAGEEKEARNKEVVNEEVNATDDSSGAPVTANGQLKPKPMPEGLWKIVTWTHKEQVKARQAAASAMQFDLLLILTKPVIPLIMLVATGQALATRPTVVVSGATGRTGLLVYKDLKASGKYEVRAFVRNATKAKDLLGCSSCNESEGIFVGDVSEPETMKAVMTGADTLVIATSSVPVCSGSLPFPMKKCHYPKGGEPKIVDWLGTKAQVAAFASAGGSVAAKQVLYVSTMGTTTPDNFLDKLDKGFVSFYHLQAEADIMASGVPFTIVKACGLGDGEPGKHKLLVGHDDASFSMALSHEVHREDVARVMVAAIEARSLALGLRFDLCSAATGAPTTDIETDVLRAAHLPWNRPTADVMVWNGILSSMFIGHALRKWVPQMSYEAQHLFCALFGVLHTMLGVSASKLEDYANREGSKMLHLAWAWSLKDVLSVMHMCQLGAAAPHSESPPTAVTAGGSLINYQVFFQLLGVFKIFCPPVPSPVMGIC